MSTCETIQENLKAYMDGELPVVSRLNVRWHLAHCAACREEIEAMEQIGNELRAADEGGLEPALRAKILSGFPDAPPEMPETAAKRSKWRSKPMLAFGAVASATTLWFLLPAISEHRMLDRMHAAEHNMSIAKSASPRSEIAASAPQAGELMYSQDYEEQYSAGKQKLKVAKAGIPGGPSGPAPDVSGWTSQPQARLASKPLARRQIAQAKSANGFVNDSDGLTTYLNQPMPAHKKAEDTGGDVAKGGFALPEERQVHREASITLEVDSPEAKSESIEEMVKAEGGYIASNQVNTEEDGTKTASLELKIPVKDFDSFLKSVAKLGNVKAKNISGEDVTEKVSDEQQTQHVLQQDARDTEAKLKTRSSRTQRREDAESLRQLKIRAAQSKARLEMLKKFATLSTVSVELREKPKKTSEAPQTEPSGFVGDLKSTAQDAMHSFAEAARMPVLLLVWALVYSPVVIALFLAYRYVRKHA